MNFLETFQQCRWVDLSVPLSAEHPAHWPGNIPMSVRQLGWYDNLKEPYFNRLLTMEEHTGTHFDAPPHFIPAPELGFARAAEAGRQTVEQVPIEALIKPACVIDASDLIGHAENGKSPRVTLARVKAWEESNGTLTAQDAVLLRTGWTDRFYRPGTDGKFHGNAPVLEKSVPAWPAPDREALGYLIDKGVKLFGTDCPSAGLLDEIVECHYLALGAGLLFVENLTNLAALPPRGAVFFFLPLKIVGGSGSPGRAIAAVPTEKQS
ncbi:MAG: cyclase family protein [Methylacidiphilales bacterium]|nr:cyclase family protein [Candidatus Methylacidiphilales bacterium]